MRENGEKKLKPSEHLCPVCGKTVFSEKEYEVKDTDFSGTMFSVVDETGEEFLYPAEDFEAVEE